LADPDPSSSVTEFDESDLNKALEHINVYKSPGPDGIHPRILYETRDIIAAPLKKYLKLHFYLKNYLTIGEWQIFQPYIKRALNQNSVITILLV